MERSAIGSSFGAPGRTHLIGGESPLLARQGEELAKGKGFAGDCESEGSRTAKRWPDVQEADTRRRTGVRSPKSSKPKTCTETVDPTGISVKVGAQYPGRSDCGAREGYRHREVTGCSLSQKSAEGIVGGVKALNQQELPLKA